MRFGLWANARAGPRGWRKRSRPAARRCRNACANACRSIGQRRRVTSVTRFGRSANARVGRRSWRSGRAIACHCDWATTQSNLGNALRVLGERESRTAQLEEAVAAFDACLTVTETAWPEERVQQVRSHRDRTRAEIARRRAAK